LIEFLLALPQVSQDAIHVMDVDNHLTLNTDGDSDGESVRQVVPPGDEDFDISHEGGEFEVFDDLTEGITKISG
jgi:hypothetical protein